MGASTTDVMLAGRATAERGAARYPCKVHRRSSNRFAELRPLHQDGGLGNSFSIGPPVLMTSVVHNFVVTEKK